MTNPQVRLVTREAMLASPFLRPELTECHQAGEVLEGSPEEAADQPFNNAKAALAARIVCSTSSDVWTAETNMASNWLHGR